MSMINKLSDERVVKIKLIDRNTKLKFTERCDRVFDCTLDKNEVLYLVKELCDLADMME